LPFLRLFSLFAFHHTPMWINSKGAFSFFIFSSENPFFYQYRFGEYKLPKFVFCPYVDHIKINGIIPAKRFNGTILLSFPKGHKLPGFLGCNFSISAQNMHSVELKSTGIVCFAFSFGFKVWKLKCAFIVNFSFNLT